MPFHKHTGAVAPERMLVRHAALALSAAAPLFAFSVEDVAPVPASVTREPAPTAVRVTANSTPSARNIPAIVRSVMAD